MYKILLALLVFLSFSSNNVNAEELKASSVLSSCKLYTGKNYSTTTTAMQRSQCLGFFLGVTSVLMINERDGIKTGICLPANLSLDEAVRYFVDAIQNRSELLEIHPTEAVLRLFKEKWGC